jgi:hypothetical protein
MLEISDLQPARTMDPYKPCWCGSGKKWKWCHKGRQDMPPANINQLLNEMFQETRKGLCLHPDAPTGCGQMIKAHTVQRGGGLTEIAEKQHVLSPKDGVRRLAQTDGRLQPVSVGINNASTFMGFCDVHDGAMFRAAEHQVSELNDEIAFLLGFRAIAYERFAKITAERWAGIQREMDRGQPFERQVQAQSIIHWTLQGTKLALEDTRRWKQAYDEAFTERDHSGFHYRGVVFDDLLPFVGCGAFMPEFDFEGRAVQMLGRASERLEHITFNLAVLNGRSVAILGWIGPTVGPAADFVRSFAALPADKVADSLVQLAFEHIENIYLRPSWWQGLPEELRDALIDRTKHGTLSGDRFASCLVPDGRAYLGSRPIKEIRDRVI